MHLRAALLSLLCIAVAAVPVAAQTSAATSSLTLQSTLPGVSFRITGDQEISGRAPVTLSPWFPGHYRITGLADGYNRWRRDIVFDGMTADTLWITLRRKSRLEAGARALVVPGWGQFYDQHPKRGWVFLAGAIAAGAGLAVTEHRYRDRLDDLDLASATVAASPTPEEFARWDRAADKVTSAQRWRQGFVWAGAGVVGLGLFDAVAFVPKPESRELLGGPARGLVPRSADEARFAMTLAHVRF